MSLFLTVKRSLSFPSKARSPQRETSSMMKSEFPYLRERPRLSM
jgi:hypothetical protein